MYCIELHNGISKIIEGYKILGFWHRGDVATVQQTIIKILYSIYFLMFLISLISGAIISVKKDETMLLLQSSVITTIVLVRILYIMWKQKEIFELLHRIGVYSIQDEEEFTLVEKKLKKFMKWITYFYSYAMVVGACITLGVPLIGSGKKLFFNVGFPLDYKNNDFSYCIAFLFEFTEMCLAATSVSFSIIVWYSLFNCGLKYKILGSELENLAVIRTVDNLYIPEVDKRKMFYRNLIAGIKSYKDINKVTQQLQSFLSELFSVQLATSAASICASVYSLAFNKSENIMELHIYFFIIFYNIFDIFMVMYFGNEIKLSSGGLSYCLFKSNWMEQSQSCQKSVIIFGERLKQAQQLVVLKLYPLTLETFTRILNAAYSLFNILKTLA